MFYPYIWVGNTFVHIYLFDVAEDTDSNFTPNVPFIEALARAIPKGIPPVSPGGIETKRVGQRTAVYGITTPQTSCRLEGGRVLQGLPCGLGNRLAQ